MKSFEFSMERIRNYKTQVLEKEKKVLSVLLRKREEIVEKINSTERFRTEKLTQVADKQSEGVSMGELLSLSFLIENSRKQIEALYIELQKAEEVIDAQREVVVAIYQDKTGMDKLEEKQVEEYRLLEAKVAEGELMQVISNQMARRSIGKNMDFEIA